MGHKSVYKADVDKSGKIVKIYGRHFMDQELLEKYADGQVKIEISKWRKPRSNRQNAFYFYIFLQSEIDCFKERWGELHSKEDMHEFNKSKFWGDEKLIEATGEIITMPGSSAAQSTVEFEERLENTRQWFRQNLDWELPYPKSQEELEFPE